MKLYIPTIHSVQIKLIPFIIVLMFLTACASINREIQGYDGAQRDSSELVTLILPYELEILKINDKQMELLYIPSGSYQIQLLPGEHELAINYQEYWGTEFSGDLVNSDVFIFKQKMSAGESYYLRHNVSIFLEWADLDMIASDITIWMEPRDSARIIKASERAKISGYDNSPNTH